MTLFRFLDAPATIASALGALPSPLAAWFRTRFGEPTVVQRLAWPALLSGGHLLISAPTGTGKTLAALVPVLAELLAPFEPASWSTSPLRVLYVAPLKALVNDAARNLQAHLTDLSAHLPPDTTLPRISVRTGDTSGLQRRHLHDEPPDVLLTTPESLAVLLSKGQAAALFANLAWVIVDEVHALAGNKRGADLALSLERLTALAPSPPRRVGLSATATPLVEAARYLVGAGRECSIVRTAHTPPSLRLEPLPEGARFLSALVERLVVELPRHRAVLVFTNTRALAERVAWALRRKLPAWDDRIAVHHSALSAPRRRDVEERFKQGHLRAVVSSTSLELGVDVGSVDLAVLVHPPGDVVRLLQRVGRAGHEPGRPRQGLVLTATAAELLESAVTLASGVSGQCEPLQIPAAPLDVLCQQILGMCCAHSWSADEMYDLVHRAAPYADLARRDFDECIAYLRGVDRHGEVWLPARLVEDGDCWRVVDARTARILRRNLGTILSEATVPVMVRHSFSRGSENRADETRFSEPRLNKDEPDPITTLSQVGEVDEPFADRLQPGDRFLLDGRCLEFRAREKGAAIVEEVPGRPRTPTWTGEGWPLSPELSRRLYLLRTRAAEALREGAGALPELLRQEYGLEEEALAALVNHFQQQDQVSEIPDATTLLIEGINAERGLELYLHTPLNRPANDALARIAVARLVRDHGRSAGSLVADLGFVLRFRGAVADVPGLIRTLLSAEGFGGELDLALGQSESLRARFRRVAQTGLMLLQQPEGRRRRVGGADWGERRLFDSVRQRDPDFVLLRQALRELRQELCDLDQALAYAQQLPALTIRCRWLSMPSPFAAAWTQMEAGEPQTALTPGEALLRLHAELMGGAGDAGAG
jgi:ATP-dependent Lhr-like helicase